jgi:hypothetical protein
MALIQDQTSFLFGGWGGERFLFLKNSKSTRYNIGAQRDEQWVVDIDEYKRRRSRIVGFPILML